MGSGIYAAVAGAKAQSQYLDLIANNLANIGTAGFKADDLRFGDHLVTAGRGATQGGVLLREPKAMHHNIVKRDQVLVDIIGQTIDFSQGPLRKTGNSLDIALEGEGFFRIELQEREFYSRDGRFHINEEGELMHSSGGYVLDDSGSMIKLEKGLVEVDEDGVITQGNTEVARLGVMDLTDKEKITKAGHSLFSYSNPDELPTEAADTAIFQGRIETSNVNAVREMTKMIKTHRHFDAMERAIRAYRELEQKSINDVGSQGQ